MKKLFASEEITLASRTILHHYRVISTILQSAVYNEVIINNLCKRIKAPKVELTEAHYLNEKQAEALLNTVMEEAVHPFDMIVILLLHTGMRRGECCGFNWDDVDFDNCTINIQRLLLYLPEKRRI